MLTTEVKPFLKQNMFLQDAAGGQPKNHCPASSTPGQLEALCQWHPLFLKTEKIFFCHFIRGSLQCDLLLYLLLQHHNHLRLGVVGAQTLDEFWVVKQLHQFDLSAGCCPLLGRPGSVELPRTHLARLLVAQPEDLTELPAANTRQVMF